MALGLISVCSFDLKCSYVPRHRIMGWVSTVLLCSVLINKLKTQLLATRDITGPAFRTHVRQCAGYLKMLHIAKVFPGILGGQLAVLFSRFALLHLNPTLQGSTSQLIVTERNLAYVEQTGVKLALKAGDAISLLNELALELPAQPLSRQVVGLLSVSAGGFSKTAGKMALCKFDAPSLR